MSRLLLFPGLLLLSAGTAAAQPVDGPPPAEITACADEAEPAPFVYTEDAARRDIIGASAHLARLILARAGHDFSITLLPWGRCLQSVAAGRIGFALHAPIGPEVGPEFLATRPYASIRPALFYTELRFADAPAITGNPWPDFRYCGSAGHGGRYPIPQGRLDLSAYNTELTLGMLRGGHCDLALANLEEVLASGRSGRLEIDGLRWIPVPGARPRPFGMLIGRAGPGAAALHRMLDDGIGELEGNGMMAAILASYGLP
jgi:polar amino acid transport system substrate-binding protein